MVGAKTRAVATAYEHASAETALLEEAEKALHVMRHPEGSDGSLNARLGAVLKTRNLKAGDLVRDWDDDGNGQIDAQVRNVT